MNAIEQSDRGASTMPKITTRIAGWIYSINVLGITLVGMNRSRLGTLTPDAAHTYHIHFHGGHDYFFTPLVGTCYDYKMWIWLGTILLFFWAVPRRNDDSQDRNTSSKSRS